MPSEHRLHPTSILFALAGSLKAFLLPAVLLLLTNRRSSPDPGWWNPAGWVNRALPGEVAIANWQFWLLLFLIPVTIASLLKYFSFRLRYEGTELVIRSGVFFRNERHVPYARIQNLDAVRNLAHRLFGVAEVRVETGGGQTPEATISVLHETVFEEMRRRVFEGRMRAVHAEASASAATDEAARAESSEANDSGIGEVESRTLLYLPVRELLLNGLLHNRGMVLVAAGASVVWEAGLFNAISSRLTGGAFRPGLVRDTVRPLMAGDLLAFLVRVGVLFAGIVLILAFIRVLSMVWSVVRLHGFRLTRVGEDLRTEYGLLTRVTATIPLKRVQALTIWETPLQRFFKRRAVRVETAGGHGPPQSGGAPKQPREWLAPIVHRDAVPALVREVLPGFDLDDRDWQTLHPRAFRRAVKPMALLGILMPAPLVYWLGWAGLAAMPLTVGWLGLVTWMHVRHTQWSATADTLVLRSGWLWREVVVVPIAKIQVVGRIESPFDRRAAMSGIRVDTAGSASPAHRITIRYLARDTAATLYERLASQTAQTALRW
jgi:putative membrane protein